VSTGRGWRGGEQQVFYLMEGLRRRGVPQRLVARRGEPLALRAKAAGLPVLAIPFWNEADVGAVVYVAAQVRSGRFTLLHLHTSQAHGLGAAAARLAGKRRPRVVVTRRVDHSIYRHSFLGLDRLKYAKAADRILCVSERVRRSMVEDGVPEPMLAVVKSGVDLARFEGAGARAGAARAALGVPPEAPLVGTVGQCSPEKGHDVLVEATPLLLREHPEAHVLVVGEGPQRAALARQASLLGVEGRVRLPGFREDVPAILAALDVFAFPSLDEGLGTSVLDALASRRPVVASSVGGIPEVVEDRRHGLLVPPRDPAALATAIGWMLAHPAEASAMAAAGRERVEREFGVDGMVEGTIREYRRALDAR
jgi:glycosyltransferase involved in cell wall biosynthesis